jgi:hypothetical protein
VTGTDRASRIIAKAGQALQDDPGPAELRRLVSELYDAAALLMQHAQDLEAGLVD